MPFYPQGKSSLPTSLLNFPGRYAWCFMESIGFINMGYMLYTHSDFVLNTMPPWNKLLAALYILHYLNRAVISPLFLAPSMSPIHLSIIFTAAMYNYFNSSCITGWLLGYGLPVTASGAQIATTSSGTSPWLSYLPYIGIPLFAIGLSGNIHAETTLFRLRREEAHRRQKSQSQSKQPEGTPKKSIYDKVYVIPPPTGVFRAILFPHYVFEWLEWLGFLLMGFAVMSPTTHSKIPPAVMRGPAPDIPLASYYVPLAKLFLQKWRLTFPFPAIVFLVNSILTTGARAAWGRKWYAERFGEKAVAGRGGFIPYFKWL